MVSEIALIAALFVITWVFILIIGVSIVNKSSEDLSALDMRLAEAISQLVDQVIQNAGDFEPPNPVQIMIARFLESKMGENSSPGNELKEIARGEAGKFVSDSISDSS